MRPCRGGCVGARGRSGTLRWRTLLSFPCRNRLLLTGTPIQNTMQELWALLHFIMPALFDSHAEFAAWFSKDIERCVCAPIR
jgi:chromatin-remodeling ATPase INO80